MGRSNRRKQKERKKQPDQRSSERKPKEYKETVRENVLFQDYYQQQGIVGEDEWEDFLNCVREPLPAAFRVTGSKSQAQQLLHLIKHDFFNQLNNHSDNGVLVDSLAGDLPVQSGVGKRDGTDIADDGSMTEQPADVLAEAQEEEVNAKKQLEDLKIEDRGACGDPQTVSADSLAAASTEKEPLRPPRCLSWYPDGLAWQLEYSRVSIRQNQTLKKLHSFLISESESGNISRQEAVSMIPPLLMHVKSHHKVLDMCAAPGSKTAQLIEYLHADSTHPMPEGFVMGNDVDNRRCYLMVHQVKRLQSPNFMIVNHDATRLPAMVYTNPRTEKEEQLLFDRILCDVPCSGDGTLRKNPEVWRTWGPGHAINLHSVQNRVLTRGLELLAVGGRLVYSTCSFNPIENEAVVAHMVNKCQGSVHLVDCSNDLPELKRSKGMCAWKVLTKKGDWFSCFAEVPEDKRSWVRPSMFPADNMHELNIDRCLRIVPHHQNTGGFFVAVLEKTTALPWQKVEREASKVGGGTDGEVATESLVESVHEPTREPPAKKIKYLGFREEPFFYLKEDNSQWPSIKKFFEFSSEFNPTQLMVRSNEGEKKRNIYLSSMSIRNVAQHNQHRIKFINTGVKVLARSEHAMCDCSYRLVQDGITSIDRYVMGRRLTIHKSDVVTLLTHENPFFSELAESTQAELLKHDVGGLLMLYEHEHRETNTSSQILLTGWRGKTSCRLYVPKFERHHLLRLCGVDPNAALVDSEWAIKGKTGSTALTADSDKGDVAESDSAGVDTERSNRGCTEGTTDIN